MNCFSPEQLPIISTLASEFKVLNRWFSGIPGPTDVNKNFLHSASSGSLTTNCGEWYCDLYPINVPTIYDLLIKENISTAMHYMDWAEAMGISPLNKNTSFFVKDQDLKKFYKKLEDGTLERYTFLVPRESFDLPFHLPNTQHPS